jgi:alanyl-tRNA synthetase
VLRRLLRRAIARARSKNGLRVHESIMARLAQSIVGIYGGHYTELAAHAGVIERTLRHEEESFGATYDEGLTRLETLLGTGAKTLSGQETFVLHDTYGFPVELTEEIAKERGIAIDRDGFEREMDAQRERARAGSKFDKGGPVARAAWTEVSHGAHSEFTSYAALEERGLTLRRVRDAEGGQLELVLDRTPFYAESGGQVGDHGRLTGDGVAAELTHVAREDDATVHRVRLVTGTRDALLAAGRAGRLDAAVSAAHRLATCRHHTATHLLHAALRETLGTHVRQAGSLVAPDRLRFDYTHFEPPSDEQVGRIEGIVSEWVVRNTPVSWQVMPIDQARAMGAMALFGEKYGAEVRMVTVEGVPETGIAPSRELCGGTHVNRTGDIGAFVLLADTAIASGVRRVEALCGHEAMRHLKTRAATLDRVAVMFQVRPEAVPEQIEKLRAELDRLRKTQEQATRGGLETEMTRVAASAITAPGGKWVVAEIAADAAPDAVRDAADRLRGQLGRGAAVLALAREGKLSFLAAVTDDLVAEKKLNASELVKRVAQVTGGSGGGKPHLALAGGKDASKLADALAEARRILIEAFGG